MSIGRRLSLLVVSELATAAVMVIAAVVVLARLAEDSRYMSEYVFAPLVDIDETFHTVDELMSGVVHGQGTVSGPSPVARLEAFGDRYEREWEVADSTLPDAVRFRSMLEETGRLPLLSEERAAVAAFRSSLRALEGTDGRGVLDADAVLRVHAALHRLNNVNLRYIEVGYSSGAAHTRKLAVLVIALGAASMFAAPFFGYLVRRAIVPRVEALVDRVKRFRELGVDEPLGPWNGDELAVLANALDTAFASIAARDKEREHFLAVAAHELKTPLTSLKGFAHVALTHRDDVELRDRALTVIERQSMRLARLVQELLWTASVDAGSAGFHPGPIDLEALTRKAIADAQASAKAHPFVLEVCGDTHVLADPDLLGLSLSSLLAEAATMVPAGAPVPVKLQAVNGAIRLTIEVREVDVPESDLEHLLEPFAVLRFEGREQHAKGRSTGLGLHLTRHIATLHAASFRVESPGPHSVAFVLDLRR